MYLRELKAYKPKPVSPNDADAHVQKFKAPTAPKSPEEANLADDLSAYESQVPEVEGQSGSEGASEVEQDWFVEEEDEEEVKH